MLPLSVLLLSLLVSLGLAQRPSEGEGNSLSSIFQPRPGPGQGQPQRGPRQESGNRPSEGKNPSPPEGRNPPPPETSDLSRFRPSSRRNPSPPILMSIPVFPGRMDDRCGAWNEWENATCWWPSTSWEELPTSCKTLELPEKLPAVMKSFIEAKLREKYSIIVADYQKRGSPPVCGHCAKSFACRTRNATANSTGKFRPHFCRKKEVIPIAANCSDSAPCSLTLEDGACPPPMFLRHELVKKVNKQLAMRDDEGAAQTLFDMGQPSDQGLTSFASMELPWEQQGGGRRGKRQSGYYSSRDEDQWGNSDMQYGPPRRPPPPPQDFGYENDNYRPFRPSEYSDNSYNGGRRAPSFGSEDRGFNNNNNFNSRNGQGYNSRGGQNSNSRGGQGYNEYYGPSTRGRQYDSYDSYNPRGYDVFANNWQSPRQYDEPSYGMYNSWDSEPFYMARDEPMRRDTYDYPRDMPFYDDRQNSRNGPFGPEYRGQQNEWSSRLSGPSGRDQDRFDMGRRGEPQRSGPWDNDDRMSSSFEKRDGPFGPGGRDGPLILFGPDEMDSRQSRGGPFGPEGMEGRRRGPEGPERSFGPGRRPGRPDRFGPDSRERGFGPGRRGGRDQRPFGPWIGPGRKHMMPFGHHEHHRQQFGPHKKFHHFSFLSELLRGTSCASTGDRCLCCCGHYIPDVENNTCADVRDIFKGIEDTFDRLSSRFDAEANGVPDDIDVEIMEPEE